MSEAQAIAGSTSLRCDVLQHQLSAHGLYSGIDSDVNLRIFMQHHVYAVWDFMSLIKSLQQQLTPSTLPWVPPENSCHANFINQLVLEEESDYALTDTHAATHPKKYASHFESYLQAMIEIGADIEPITTFIETVKTRGLEDALQLSCVPKPSKNFMRFTFKVIEHNKPYLTAAALAYGREDLVPLLFQCLEDGLQISAEQAPNLFAYLNRHIQLDGEEHGPLAIQLLKEVCGGSSHKQVAAIKVAEEALEVRLKFWDEIQSALLH